MSLRQIADELGISFSEEIQSSTTFLAILISRKYFMPDSGISTGKLPDLRHRLRWPASKPGRSFGRVLNMRGLHLSTAAAGTAMER